MPEGHLIHRYAADQNALLGGSKVHASSPQGRFTEGACAIDGAVLGLVDPHGKHLFYRLDDRPTVHVHLGMQGRFVVGQRSTSSVIPAARLRLEGMTAVVHLIAPAKCELLGQAEERRVRETLGPDPLRDDARPDRALALIARSRAPIGSVLLDQSVIAGIGNALRAEILYVLGIHPARLGTSLTAQDLTQLWQTAVDVMRSSRDSGHITSREPSASEEEPSDAGRRYVYKREFCAACGSPVQTWMLGGRMAYACPRCQRV